MTQQQWQQRPPMPPPPPPINPPPPGKRSAAAALIAAVVGIVLALGAIGVLFGDPQPTSTPVPAVQTTDTPAVTEPPATSPPEPTYDTPKPSDFKLTIKVLEKDNFGSAGSLITFRVNANWTGTYDPDKTYEVVYEVRGDEDGPMINTMTVTGDEYERPSEETASTPSSSTRLTAKVTSVEEI